MLHMQVRSLEDEGQPLTELDKRFGPALQTVTLQLPDVRINGERGGEIVAPAGLIG